MLLQEKYKDDPWKLLVCCILLNITTRKQVDKVLDGLLSLWGSPQKMVRADRKELESVIKPLGLQVVRSKRLVDMSREWIWLMEDNRNQLTWPPPLDDVSQLSGVGLYALDSYSTFVLGKPRNVSEDKEIQAYLVRRGLDGTSSWTV